MDLKIGTVLKAALIILGFFVSQDTLAIFDNDTVNALSGALAILAGVGYDVWETIKLHRAGVTKADGR